MSKLNKIITNQPVVLTEEEVNNLSETLSAVRTAGGGEGGHLYTGDNKYIGVDNGNYKIKFLDNAAAKLESISSKLDKTEAANTYLTSADAETTYQTKADMLAYYDKTETSSKIQLSAEFAKYQLSGNYVNQSDYNTETNAIWLEIQTLDGTKQNKLNFDTDEHGNISAINDIPLAGAGGITGDYYSASNPSGFINSAQAETQILAKKYITSGVSELDNFYSKSQTSGAEEIANAFDNIPKYILNGDSNITATSAQDGKNVRWDLAVNAHPTVTDTTLTGENGIYTHTTTKSGEWCVELVQSAYAAINEVQNKLDTTVAAQTYQPKGDYVSSTDITDMATKTWVGTQGYITEIPSEYVTDTELQTTLADYATKTLVQNTSADIIELIPSTANLATKTDLQIVSAGVDYVSAHAITAHQSLTDYYKKSQTSGATEIANALNTKVDKPIQQTGKLVYDGDTSAWVTLPAGTTTIVQGQGSVTANYDSPNSTYTVSLLASAENALLDVNNKIDSIAVAQTYQTKSDMANYLTTSDAADTYQPKGNYATSSDISDMATKTWVGQQGFYTKASGDNDYAPLSITATVNTLTAASASWNNKVDKPTALTNKYLVLRTDSNGDVSGWCDFQDQSYSKSEANGTFVATANIDNTTLSGDGKSVSTKLGVKTDVIATKDYVNSSFLPLSGGTVSGQLVVSGDGNFDTENLKFIRSGQNGYGRIGMASNGALAVKVDDSNSNTTQINVAANASYNELIQVQHGGTTAYLIPAVTSTTTAGLTNDGILHIILES